MVVISPQTRIVALDIETTGLSAARHRIIELAAVCWQNGEETGHFHTLVDPRGPIPRGVIKVHGITDSMVRGQPVIHEVLPDFIKFCEADVIVAHNSPFDIGFINTECARTGLTPFTRPVHDSCSLARQRLPGCPNYKLETLKAALNLGRGQEHRALEDARDCLAVFLQCLQRETPRLHLPIEPPPLSEALSPLSDALRAGGTVTIEYRDTRGRLTLREVQPIHIDDKNMMAFCLLRNDQRHFALDRIERVLRSV